MTNQQKIEAIKATEYQKWFKAWLLNNLYLFPQEKPIQNWIYMIWNQEVRRMYEEKYGLSRDDRGCASYVPERFDEYILNYNKHNPDRLQLGDEVKIVGGNATGIIQFVSRELGDWWYEVNGKKYCSKDVELINAYE